MKDEFDRAEHFKKHKDRNARIKKDIRDRKINKILKEEIRLKREAKDG